MNAKVRAQIAEMLEKHPEEFLDVALAQPYWVHTLKTDVNYVRYEDDTRHGHLGVTFSCDGDGWVEVFTKADPKEHNWMFRFRMPGGGGGDSMRVRNALLLLAEAIRQDNEKRPQNRGEPGQ